MTNEKMNNRYNELFSEKDKIEAFDKIAEKYYFGNFGSTNKSDLDTLIFSLYLEQILKKDQYDYNSYSDYRLSKELGLTQSKVSNLKVKKELLYPYPDFDWRISFQKVVTNAIFEDNKIKIFIRDKNLFLELKNAIEENGGFIEIQLTPNLLQIKLCYFLDLMIAISEEKDRNKIRSKIHKEILTKNKDIDAEQLNQKSFGASMGTIAKDTLLSIIETSIPHFGGVVKNIITAIIKKFKR